MKHSNITIDANVVTKWLGICITLLLILSSVSVAAYYLLGPDVAIARKAMKFFYVDLELNAPAVFSSVLHLISASLLTVIFFIKRQHDETGTAPWAVLACGFALMAVDETLAIHERLIEPMRDVLGDGGHGIFYFAWVVPAIVVVALLGLYFTRFLIGLPHNIFRGFMMGAVLFLGGAIGLELFEGSYSEVAGRENLVYIVLVSCEETAEMLGVSIFLRTLIEYMADEMSSLRLRFEGLTSAEKRVPSSPFLTARKTHV